MTKAHRSDSSQRLLYLGLLNKTCGVKFFSLAKTLQN
jgi:hypothetical protein